MRIYYSIIAAVLFTAGVPTNLQAQVVVSALYQNWNGSHWENSTYITDFNNSSCEEVYSLVEKWDSLASIWDTSQQDYYSYYGSGKLNQDSVQLWNTPATGWNNNSLLTYSYDGSNYLINETIKTWTSSWQNSTQTDYVNNADGTPHTSYLLHWSGSVWDSLEMQKYIYNTPGQLDTELVYNRISGVWQNTGRNYYIYTSGHATGVTQTWSGTTNSWQNAVLQNWFPDMPLPDSAKNANWNTTASVWDTVSRIVFTYAACTPAAVKQINAVDPLAIYPNPTTGHFTVTGLTQGQSVEIYNYTGQRIEHRMADNHAMDFNIASYASGMYLVRVQNPDGSIVAQNKMVKIQ